MFLTQYNDLYSIHTDRYIINAIFKNLFQEAYHESVLA